VIDIAAYRLRAQRLIGEPATSPLDVVRELGAVQAQDYPAARWALGQRTAGATDAEIGRLFDEGRILRTHVLRPTWHFVLPEDSRWLLALTGPRVRRSTAGRLRQLAMDDREVDRAIELMCAALAGERFLTRNELGEVLESAGISPEGQRLPHFLMAAELEGAIISGPRRGKQLTYARLTERAPEARSLERDEAVAELVRRYFRSHGPAQIQDFTWWSGLTVTDTRTALALAGEDLQRRSLDGKEYWFDAAISPDGPPMPIAHLLPSWDEYTVAYRDRSAALPPGGQLDPATFPYGILSSVITIAGRVRGAWRRTVVGGSTRIELRPVDRLNGAERAAVEAACLRMGDFLEVPVEPVWLE
jgi:hypothetical protein